MSTKLFSLFIFYFVSARCEHRISGGENTSNFVYPYATSLMTNDGEEAGTFAHSCGGTILTANAILSAASCFYTNSTLDPASWWQARVGSSLVNSGGVIHYISSITPHPDFSSDTLANDLAVLKTTVPITIQPGIVDVAYIAGAVYTLNTNQPIWGIGWGATSSATNISQQLQHVQFWVVDRGTCASRFAAVGFTVTENMVCTGWLDVGIRGHCPGDAGSPLVDSGVVVGVNSWTAGECGGDGWFPSVNTMVNRYTSWIVSAAIA